MHSRPELSIKPRSSSARRGSTAFLWRTNSSMRLNEQQRKAAKYEAMIQRFQIRRVEGGNIGSKLSSRSIIVDKHFNSGRANWQRLSFRRMVRKLKKSVYKITPDSPSSQTTPAYPTGFVATLHGVIMFCIMHFQLFYLPFAPIFYPLGSTIMLRIDLVLEFLAIVDIGMTFNEARATKQSDPLVAKRRLASQYLRGWFIFDVIIALPIQFFKMVVFYKTHWHALTVHSSLLMLMRLVRLRFRGSANLISNRLSTLIRYSRYTHLFDIARLLWIVLVIAHYMACFWHLLDDHPLQYGSTVAQQYIATYFYAISLIHGQGNISDDWSQNLLGTFIILVGSVIVATVFGNVAMLVSNFNANATTYQHKMESVFATMDKMELPERLRDRIQQYYAHVWGEYESLDGDLVKFQRELTHTLGLEVGLYKYMGLVNDIPFWIDCSPDFIAQIVLTLTVRVYLPDDFVVRQGEICDEMFMINRGICEVSKTKKNSSLNQAHFTGITHRSRVNSTEHLARVDPTVGDTDGKTSDEHADDGEAVIVRASLRHGQAFGEMSLLMNYGQPNSVRAICFVEMCIFGREAFQRIISRYPVDRRRVVKSIVGTCIQKQEVPFDWEQMCQAELQRRELQHDNPVSLDMLTSSEVVNIIVDKVIVNRPDNSIVYGFQCPSVESTDCAIQEVRGEAFFANVPPLPATSPPSPNMTEGRDSDDSHILLTKMVSMLTDVTAAVERLERLHYEHQGMRPNGEEAIASPNEHADIGSERRNYRDADVRSRAVTLGSALEQQISRTGSNNSNGSIHSGYHHPFIGHSQSEYSGSTSSPGSGKRWTVSDPSTSYRGVPSSTGLMHATNPIPSSPQSHISALSMQANSTPALPEGTMMANMNMEGPIANRLVSVDAAANVPSTSMQSHHATASMSSTRRQSDPRVAQNDSPATRPKMTTRTSVRLRGSVDNTHDTKPLRLRFLSTRLSNPSSARGTSWGVTPRIKRANTEKEVTLADQLWERRRRQPRGISPSQETSRRERVSPVPAFIVD